MTLRRTRITKLLSLCGFVMGGLSGCASLGRQLQPRWFADYSAAERRAHDSGSKTLIWYKEARPGRSDPLQPTIESKAVRRLTRDYVGCTLVNSYEPDRRYVAQFSVERAPALILVHEDGTFHAQAGSMSVEEVARFLATAKAPGAKPTINPYVPRPANYSWYRDITAARREAKQTGRPMLVVFHRLLSGDWREMRRLFSRHEVYRRFAGMVHCRVGIWNPWAKAFITPYGALRLPALVIVQPEGGYQVMEMPTSYEAVVRFADRCSQPNAVASGSPTTAAAQP